MNKGIYQGEDFDLDLDIFDLHERLPLDISDIEFAARLYTDIWEPVLLSTTEPFEDLTFSTGLLKLEKRNTSLHCTIRNEVTMKMRPGNVNIEVKALLSDKWESVGVFRGIAEILPSAARL